MQKLAKESGRDIGFYTVGVITCRPTQKEAEDYYHYSVVEHADWSAVDGILALKNISPQTVPMQEFVLKRNQYAQGMGGLPIVGDPDFVAKQLADLSQAGLTGIGVSLVNYADELPFFCDEVLPRLARMGVREKQPRPRNDGARRACIIPSSNRMVEAGDGAGVSGGRAAACDAPAHDRPQPRRRSPRSCPASRRRPAR